MCSWDTEESVRRWDAFAGKYVEKFTEQGDLNREVLLNPALFELLGDVRGKRILDAGCGEGYLGRLLARRGANVTAVDYSNEMLRIARERTPNDLDIEFRHGNCERLDFLPAGSFDIVVSNLVLIDLADYEAAIREAYRVLMPGGCLVLSLVHPCFCPPESGWVKNEQGERLHRRVDCYFAEGPFELVWQEHRLLQFHRTLTSYVRALIRAGFVLTELVEPLPSEEALEVHPEYQSDLRTPNFVALKVRK